jgi:hypothetical protein
MLWSVPKSWPDETCFILAGGPSLRGFDADVLRGHGRVITINDSWRLAPWASVFYFCDEHWWQYQMAKNLRSISTVPASPVCFHEMIYRGFWVTSSPAFQGHPQVHYLRLTGQLGLETAPLGLRHGSNSTYQAMNLAVHYDVRRIVLLGVDMRAINGRTHWHDEIRPDGFESVIRDSMLPCFDSLVEPLAKIGVEVINATPESGLKCWPFQSLESLLETTRV